MKSYLWVSEVSSKPGRKMRVQESVSDETRMVWSWRSLVQEGKVF